MSTSKVIEKIKQFCTHLRMLFKNSTSEKSVAKPDEPQKIEFYSMAYKFIGEKIEQLLPLFKDLDLNLQKSGIRVSFKAYVSLTIFTAILLPVVALAIIPSILFFGFRVPLIPSFMFGVGGGLFACAFSIIGFYVYPVYRADKIKRDLEDELPFTTGYMAILSSAGVSPEKIFYSLSNLNPPLAITSEAKNIVRNINLFGLDVISALEETSRLTPSERFREMLEGFISTIHSGGNLARFLREKSMQYMKLKRISLRKFSDTLSILSEFYVALLVTGPLLLVIMLAVMSMLGGGLGALGPDILLNILTYIGIPLGSIMFLIILDAVSPKW
ncbi:MAG: type II secretion system F family protein [Candidatus Bathyarchaeia archaeon]